MRVVDLINKKKLNKELSRAEINFLIDGYVKDLIPDYQMSALLMAIALNGLTSTEQVNLTFAMLKSGDQIDLSEIDGIKVDKHSTGGVGDKTTLIVAPLVASCGIYIPKMSGRGLGHTGGTIDKLESIPGFKTSLTSAEFIKQIKEIKLGVVGQTANIAPADKKLYALRDVTATVDSIGLIASSIMSKKLATGATHIMLDVKVGGGAFMQNSDDARQLAKSMVEIGKLAGRKTAALLSDMDQPLGYAVGNAIEVIEAIETLKGRGPSDLLELCLGLVVEILMMSGKFTKRTAARRLVEEKIKNKDALRKFEEMIIYQGGNPEVMNNYDLLPRARNIFEVKSEQSGYVQKIHTREIGNICMQLGAGRSKIDEEIDFAAGLRVLKKVGDRVEKGDILAEVHTNKLDIVGISESIRALYQLDDQKVERRKIILEIIE